MKKLLIAVLFIMFALPSYAANIKLENTSKEKRIVTLYWITHNYKNYQGPVPIAGAELKPGEVFDLESDWPAGIYCTEWSTAGLENFKNLGVFCFEIVEKDKLVIVKDSFETERH